jgi:cytochrome c oxidase cbb3-type subunit III
MAMRRSKFFTIGSRIAPFLLSGALLGQVTGDPEEGTRLFRAKCASCHGLQGNGGGGGIDLLQGKFKRPASDLDIWGYLRDGIPGTAMDKVNVTEKQAGDIIAYMRARAKSRFTNDVSGDAVRGKAVFESKGGCLNCHAVKGNGSHFGPDLSDIGSARKPAEIERSLIDPDADIAPQNRLIRLVPPNGQPIIGRQLNEDTFTVQVIDSKDQLRTFERSAFREITVLDHSPMPSVAGNLTSAEIADLVTYLAGLKAHSGDVKP